MFELTPKKFHISAGETVPEQVHCCMRVLQEFQGCSVEVDGVQLLRTKFLGRKFRTSRSGGPVMTSSTSLAAKVWICSWSSRRWWICRCKTPFVCRFREACGLWWNCVLAVIEKQKGLWNVEVLSQVLCFWIWFYSGTIQGDSFANYWRGATDFRWLWSCEEANAFGVRSEPWQLWSKA